MTLTSDHKSGEPERVVFLSNSSAPKQVNTEDQSSSLSEEGKIVIVSAGLAVPCKP